MILYSSGDLKVSKDTNDVVSVCKIRQRASKIFPDHCIAWFGLIWFGFIGQSHLFFIGLADWLIAERCIQVIGSN